jgi:hypothetical protein
MFKFGAFSSRSFACLLLPLTIAAFSASFSKAQAEDANTNTATQSKAGKVEVTQESADKRMRVLDEVISSSDENISPEGAKAKKTVLNDLHHYNEEEPSCWYPY